MNGIVHPRVDPIAEEGFTLGAHAYERARPSYPPELIDELVRLARLGPGCRVMDLAAGTGKLTRFLAATGANVTAVEPVKAMRDQLVANTDGVDVRDGTAEAIPVANASMDLLTVAQAFHWFDAPVAFAEIRRVLAPGGVMALVWNIRDRRVDWVRRWDQLIRDVTPSQPFDSHWQTDWLRVVASAEGFLAPTAWSHDWVQEMDAEMLVARTASVSVVAPLPAGKRRALFDQVRALAASHPDLAGRAAFGFPYVTTVFTAAVR